MSDGTPPIRAFVGRLQRCAVSLVCAVREHLPRVAKHPQELRLNKHGIHETQPLKFLTNMWVLHWRVLFPIGKAKAIVHGAGYELDNNMVGGVLPSPHNGQGVWSSCMELGNLGKR